jgi:hypothetical protein
LLVSGEKREPGDSRAIGTIIRETIVAGAASCSVSGALRARGAPASKTRDSMFAKTFVGYRTIRPSRRKIGKGALNLQGLGVTLARAAQRRQTDFPLAACWES